ncbi:hypothetical protein [Campylobacter phage CP39]|nr:hypothetical protein [Campylobacter phage CP39]
MEKSEFLKNLGYRLIDASANIVECPNKHIFRRLFSDFKRGTTICTQCEKEEKVNFLNNLGYEVISENLSKGLIVKCKNGHTIKRSYVDFKNGSQKCPKCDKQNKIKFIQSLGYEVVSRNLTPNIELKCKNGHTFKTTYSNLVKGFITCQKCYNNDKVKFLNNLGYKIISNNLSDNLEVECKHGHKFKRVYASFKNGITYCPVCKDNNKIKYLNNIGYEVISENLADELKIKCKNGHIFNRAWHHIKNGLIICNMCDPQTNSFEKEVLSVIGECVINNYSVLGNKELDFYIPSINIAIECNGNYWHSEQMGKHKNYHLNKTLACESKNIRLIHIFEYLWYSNSKVWANILNMALGRCYKLLYTCCEIKQVTQHDEELFFNNNHPLGYTNSSICYGLYHKNELMFVMSFLNNGKEYELIRMCSKLNIEVVGGAEYILENFKKEYDIVTYVDRSYESVSTYNKLGFEIVEYLEPSPIYVKTKTKVSQDPAGCFKIWDCGKIKLVKPALRSIVI